MKVPRYILDVFNDPQGFDRLFCYFMQRSTTQREAYERTVDEVRRFAPNAVFYADYENFKAIRYRKQRDKRQEIEVPQEVLNVLKSRDDFEEFYWKFYRAHDCNSDRAFSAMMEYLHKWLPNYRPYASADSFRKVMNRKRSKRRD